jgi:hypothetical protein
MELNLRATKELFNMSGPVAPAGASIGMRSNIFMRPGGQRHDCLDGPSNGGTDSAAT